MCLLIFAFQSHPRYPLLLAANRDEFHARPTRPSRFWEEHPQLLAGKDLEAGGTWMGVTRQGRFAAITNFRDPARTAPAPRSRGDLPLEFLTGDEPQLRYDNPFQLGARALETGTTNVIGLAALGASVELIQTLGVPAIHAHVDAYLDALESGLVARGFDSKRAPTPAQRSTLLGVGVPGDVRLSKLAGALRNRGVVCNTPDGLMRFAPHWPNPHDEVPRVLDAVDEDFTLVHAEGFHAFVVGAESLVEAVVMALIFDECRA